MALAKMNNFAIFESVKLKQLKLPTLANIILFGAIVRIALLVYALFAPEIIYDGDSREYLALAQNLTEHGVYEAESDRPFPSDSVRPPIYPAFLALFHLLGDGTPFLALLAQTLLSIANIWLTFRLAKQLGAGDNIAKIAALAIALDVSSIIYSGTIMAETLFTTLLLLFAGALLKTIKTPDFRNILMISVFTAGLILTKPVATFLPFASVLLIVSFANVPLRKRTFFVGLHILLVVLLLTPWAMRNVRKHDFLGISTVQSFNLLYYNGALARAKDEGISIDAAEDALIAELHAGLHSEHVSAGEYAAAMQTLGIKTIFKHLGSYMFLHVQGMVTVLVDPGRINLSRLLYGEQSGAGLLEAFSAKGFAGGLAFLLKQQPALILLFGIIFLWQVFVLVVSISGCISTYKQYNRLCFWLLMALVLYFVFITGPIGAARFRAPIMPFLAILAGFGIERLRNKFFA